MSVYGKAEDWSQPDFSWRLCYFLWCDRYFASGGLSDLAGVTMPIPSLLMTLSFTSGPISIVVKVLLTLLIRVNTFSPEVSHTPYIRLAVLLTLFSSMGEEETSSPDWLAPPLSSLCHSTCRMPFLPSSAQAELVRISFLTQKTFFLSSFAIL